MLLVLFFNTAIGHGVDGNKLVEKFSLPAVEAWSFMNDAGVSKHFGFITRPQVMERAMREPYSKR